MNKLIFRKLYIFSSIEKKAKIVEFVEGKNIITSSPTDGTDRGKSVIMRSLYHTLGADCYFDDKWNDDDKSYIVNIELDGKGYFVYRCNRLFKVFDNNLDLIFKTIDRKELATLLFPIFNFAVQLPSRDEEKFEITPPAYNYLLYFLDQDKLSGPNFSSFEKLAQYPNYKENVLFYHFGAFDENYYNIIRRIEKIKEENSNLEKRKLLVENMLEKVFANLKDATYSKNIDLLRIEVNKSREEYAIIAKNLSEIKGKLISLRNEKDEIINNLNGLKIINKSTEKDISSLVDHSCPLCKSNVADTTELRIGKYNMSDDIILLSNDLQISITSIEYKIQKQENLYKEWLESLKSYEKALDIESTGINDVLKHKGYIEVKDSLIEELGEIKNTLAINATEEKGCNKEKRKYDESKAAINKKYYELMLSDKIKFGLEEVDAKSFEKVIKNFSAGGSNKPISTVIWYINLIKIKNQFNPKAINFPIVFDSPNNAETDAEKRVQVYKYLVDNIDEKNQLIVSGIGYNPVDFKGVSFDNVIQLDNAKYEVLCDKDYEETKALLRQLCNS